jgi:hypothetical protein
MSKSGSMRSTLQGRVDSEEGRLTREFFLMTKKVLLPIEMGKPNYYYESTELDTALTIEKGGKTSATEFPVKILSDPDFNQPQSLKSSRLRKEGTLSYNDESTDFLGRASYTSLSNAPEKDQFSESFKLALKEFFLKNPEWTASPQKVEFLQYCYKHYVNFDPHFRDLSVPEKLEQAGQMASEFWGKMFKV